MHIYNKSQRMFDLVSLVSERETQDVLTGRTLNLCHLAVTAAPALTSFQTICTFSFMYLGYITLVTIENSFSWFIMRNAPFHVPLTGRTCRHLRGALV